MIKPGSSKLTEKDLIDKHPLYEANIESWLLYDLVYKSGKPLIEYALTRHPRESFPNYVARLNDGYVFNFGKSIIELFNFYLCEKDVIRDIDAVEGDPLWERFSKDCDLNGTDYNVFIDEAQKVASVYGAVGILVNKPPGGTNVAEDLKKNVYPYYALYSLPNILDWQWEKDPYTHRRKLVYLKLREKDDSYLLWWPDRWEIWQVGEEIRKPSIIDLGLNPLGEIPFLWMSNLKDITTKEIGVSDLIDISHIVISIAQNLSAGEEMIKYAGFPILRMPMEKEGEDDGDEQLPIGQQGVFEYDPTLGESGMPTWMPTEIIAPVTAVLNWIDRKADEIYRVAHLSGVHGQRKSNNEVASGLAIRYEFSQLNSVLISKSINQSEAEMQALRYWLMWQGKENKVDSINIRRSQQFSIDELTVALDNAITGFNRVISETFRKRVMEKIVKYVLPDLSEEDKKLILSEIDNNMPDVIEIIHESVRKSKSVRTGLESRADHSNDE